MAITAQLNGWKGQAERLLTAHTGLGTKAGPTPKRSARWSSPEPAEAGAETADSAAEAPPAEAREAELERELELVRSRVGGLERRLAWETATSRSLREQLDTVTATAEDASKRANQLEDDISALRSSQAQQPDQPTREELVELVTQKEASLGDAADRIEFLEAALGAAERECTRRDDEIATANERLRSETGAFGELIRTMSGRVVRTEKLLLNLQQYVLAHAAKTRAAEERVREATIACGKTQSENEQLRGLLNLTLTKIEELERSHAELTAGTEALLKAAAGRAQADAAPQPQPEDCGYGPAAAPETDSDPTRDAQSMQPDAGDTSPSDWTELAELLMQLISRKCVTPARGRARPALVFASAAIPSACARRAAA